MPNNPLAGLAGQTSSIAGSVGIAAIVGTSLLTFGVGLGISFVASTLLGKLGKKSSAQRPPLLLDVPQSQAFSGSPSIYALGHRIRVPAFLMYRQAPERAQRPSSGGGKGGAQARGNVRQVLYDCAYALNDRPTNRLIQLAVNGKAAYYSERNFVFIETHRWAGTAGGGALTIAMTDRDQPDFSQFFTPVKRFQGFAVSGTATSVTFPASSFVTNAHQDQVIWIGSGTGIGQFARIQSNTTNVITFKTGFTWSPVANGTSFCQIDGQGHNVRLQNWSNGQDGYWTVFGVTAHTSAAPSTMTLVRRSGQTIANCTGGTELAPARIERSDNALIDNFMTATASGSNGVLLISPLFDFYNQFRTGDHVYLRNFRAAGPVPALNGGTFRVNTISQTGAGSAMHLFADGWTTGTGPWDAGTYDTAGRVEWDTNSRFLAGTMEAATFYQGTDLQTADAVLVARLGADVPGFRGTSYVVLKQFNATELGNAPNSAEAILEPDPSYGPLSAAIQELHVRAGLEAAFVNAAACTGITFHGSYLRGPQSSLDVLASWLLLYQVCSQDRAGTLYYFPVDDAPIVTLLNDSDRSEMGVALSGGYSPKQLDSAAEEKDLDHSVTLRYQDVARSLVDGSTSFGLRHPSGNATNNKAELNFTHIATSPNVARDAAATILRRSWVNAKRVALPLGYRRINVLENDILRWTDDQGEIRTNRVIDAVLDTRTWTMEVQTVEEDVSLGIIGSAFTGVTNDAPVPEIPVPTHRLEVLDIPPLDDAHAYQPGVYIAACSQGGGVFRGAIAYGSLDGGNHYPPIATFDAEVCMGEATDALADGIASEDPGGGTTIDASSTVTVRLDALGVDGGLSSATTADVLAGANRFILGDEIMAFETATQVDDTTWTLTDLYRGLRGTPVVDHAIGDRFVLLTDFAKKGGRFVPLSGVAVGDSLDVKLVPAGQTLADVTAETTVLELWNVRPLPPYDAGSGFLTASGSDFIFAPLPKTRLNMPLGSAGPFPYDESFEEYVLTLYTSSSYVTTAGTLTFTSRSAGVPITQRLLARTTLYTAAMQTADGFTPTITPGTLYYGVTHVGDAGASREWRGVV